MADGPVGAAQELSAARPRHGAAAWVVIAAGVAAALHVGKLPPAIPALQQALGLSLVQAGFLLSMVQLAGMGAGLAVGTLADGLGLRRSLLLGLGLLALTSAAGALATGPAALMALRALEGFGFLLVVLPAPGLLRRLVPAARLARTMGLWGAYMPVATATALLAGPLAIEAVGWRGWWGALALLSLLTAGAVLRTVPLLPPLVLPTSVAVGTLHRLRDTLAAPGPWLLAACFACYAGQWLAVVGFLPTLVRQAGADAALTGVLTALVAAVNIAGNVGAGRLLHRGWPAPRLLAIGFGTLGACAVLAFADLGLGAAARYAAVLLFSGVGGLVPGTLFALVVRLAPAEHLMSATVGWMQQGSAFGQFAGPPLVAWLASRVDSWHFTWGVTGAAALAGVVLSRAIARRIAR